MIKETFTKIYTDNLWASAESKSGSGSELQNTEVLRKELSILFKKYEITSVLDIPCGDFNWMKEVDLSEINYLGADIVEELIQSNNTKYPNKSFTVLNLIEDELPKADLVFVRDCLGHLSNENVLKALENIKRSGSKYLLATSFTKWSQNPDIIDGGWKCINLMIAPFYMNPVYLINENCQEGYPHYNDKCMLLFDLTK
jgi:hypothetical protein